FVVGIEVLRRLSMLRQFQVTNNPVLNVLEKDGRLMRTDTINDRQWEPRVAKIGQDNRGLDAATAACFATGALPDTTSLKSNAVAGEETNLIESLDGRPGGERNQTVVAVIAL